MTEELTADKPVLLDYRVLDTETFTTITGVVRRVTPTQIEVVSSEVEHDYIIVGQGSKVFGVPHGGQLGHLESIGKIDNVEFPECLPDGDGQ